jgi:hypothetical protein
MREDDKPAATTPVAAKPTVAPRPTDARIMLDLLNRSKIPGRQPGDEPEESERW